jgi:hypothetical protein
VRKSLTSGSEGLGEGADCEAAEVDLESAGDELGEEEPALSPFLSRLKRPLSISLGPVRARR